MVETTLGRLEGVKSARVRGPGRDKYFYELRVLESKALLPSQFDKFFKDVKKANPDADYPYRGLEIEAAGAIEKSGDGWLFTARGSKQKYALSSKDALKAAAGVTVSGKVTESPEKDGKKQLPVIEVKSVRESDAKK